MCVIFFYANSNPEPDGYKLILASNRDEFYARETRSAAKWANAEHVYGGIDLEPGREGGTWLAISGKDGIFKVGALLNLTGEPKPRNAIVNSHNNILHNHQRRNNNALPTTTITSPSHHIMHNDNFLLGRGMIVSDYVTSYADECNIEHYNRTLIADSTKYSAFNFISVEIGASKNPAKILLCSNVPPSLETYTEQQCYGFGNSLPAIPFEKVRYGQQRFQQIVDEFNAHKHNNASAAKAQKELIANLQELLKSKEKHWPDAELKRRAPNWGEHLSALNVDIAHEGYGSRTHTIVLIDANDKMHFIEETMAGTDPAGIWTQTHLEKQYFIE